MHADPGAPKRRRRTIRPLTIASAVLLLTFQAACAYCTANEVNETCGGHNDFCAQYIAEGQLVEAEARCKLALEFCPKYAEPHNLLGLIEYKRGRIDMAIDYFKKAISYKPDFAEAFNNLGAIFLEQGDKEQAEDLFREGILVDPGFVSARVNLGLVLMQEGKDDEAREQYLRCVELDPNACDCRMGMGVLAIKKEDFKEANTHFLKHTEICPLDANGWYNLGWTFLKLGQCADSVDTLAKCLEVKSDHAECRQNLVAAYDCLGKQDGAVGKLMDKIRENPGDPDLHLQLGALYEDRKLYDRALNEYLNAIKLDENKQFAIAYFRAARIFDRNMQTQETIDHCQKFVDLLRDDKLAKEKEWCVGRVKELQFK